MMGNNSGFTLVEMALVLIIIGIIIGAVVKGKDLVRGAEQKRIYSKFLSEWRIAYLNFYDRTGKRLGDFYDAANTAAGQDGICDTDEDGDGAVADTDRNALEVGPTAGTAFKGLDNVGLDSPVTNTPNSFQYDYTDVDGVTHNMKITFLNGGNYNYMQITPIPTELAIAIDTMIDGEADGTSGDFQEDAAGAWDPDPATIETARWRLQF
ncbi:MAG: prepilin-type N-terminal cleavage/methylation domain-containing protein [Desulfatitalea sp.]|nr:prepilin-type N-terminal cleavage/methylation domain-containing protein [Desulfatitalea sp.]NNJ99985.1 prepilin-type N-terminal cleavage/methylation domain-containing protein [Desulfatitalea sp.]